MLKLPTHSDFHDLFLNFTTHYRAELIVYVNVLSLKINTPYV